MSEEVQVDPGDLEDFAKRMTQLADEWGAEGAVPNRVLSATDGDYDYPTLGEFTEAGQFRTNYGTKLQEVFTAFTALHGLLEGLADGSKKIAENYRSTEELNAANVDQVNQLLDQSMAEAAPQETNPQGGNQQGDPNATNPQA